MTELRYGGKVELKPQTAQLDAFSRLRVSNPYTAIDSKLLFDKNPLFWSEKLTAGTGTATSTHSVANARVRLAAVDLQAAVRQTYQRVNYQPGKSQLVIMTFAIAALSGVATILVGLSNGTDGIELVRTPTNAYWYVRKNGGLTRQAQQADWDDPMDGTGPSGETLDWTAPQIMFFDFEWLGVGTIRCGFFIDGRPVVAHTYHHANDPAYTAVYMSTPNLPLRYAVSCAFAGAVATLDHICSTVIVEGGQEHLGIIRAASNENTKVDADVAGTIYAMVGIRLKTAYLGADVRPENVSILGTTGADHMEWLLLLNPTVAGTFTYADETDSAVQSAKGATVNTVTGGYVLARGYASAETGYVPILLDLPRPLGADIDGVVDTYVLAVRPLSANLDVYGSIGWRELL